MFFPQQISNAQIVDRLFQGYDHNKDQVIDTTHAKGLEHVRFDTRRFNDEDGWSRFETRVYQNDAFIKSADSNNDGKLTRQEALQAVARFDHNGPRHSQKRKARLLGSSARKNPAS